MKKITVFLLMMAVLVGTLAGCGKSEGSQLPKGLDGIDTAKLILANERLDSALFQDNDSLFVSGATAFSRLYDIAEENMIKYGEGAQDGLLLGEGSLRPLLSGDPFSADLHQELANGSVLEIDGNTYRWSNFGEYSNSYDYFLNITSNVKQTAEIGAGLIDDTKKYVRIVDTWVSIEGDEYYLHVEEDSEIIFRRFGEQESLCRRYRRADGVNVYEIFQKHSSGGCSVMTYIPGELYEYSHISGNFNHNFLAQNTKGYWEVVDVGRRDVGYNVSCMVLKDDICYDSIYDSDSGTLNMLKVISSDRKTDLLNLYLYPGGASVDLQLQGFRGVDYIEVVTDRIVDLAASETPNGQYVLRYDVPSNPEIGEHTVYFPRTSDCTLVLKNGLSLNVGDRLLDGKIEVSVVRAGHVSMQDYGEGYIGELSIRIQGDVRDEILDTLEDFFALTGLNCNRNFDTVRAGISQAYTELDQMTKYHTWNGSPIASIETLDAGYANNLAKHEAFAAMLDAVKDAEVINFEDKDAVALKIRFAPIVSQSAATVENDARSVSVRELVLSVEDTTLFVVGEGYTVNFALLGIGESADMGLIPIETKDPLSTVYADEDVFSVRQSASLEIPVPTVGEYTLVAYLSTADGIRSSGYAEVAFTQVKRFETTQDGVRFVIDSGKDSALMITVSENADVQVSVALPSQGAVSYAEMHAALTEAAYPYGFIEEGAKLERSTDGVTFTPLTGSETALDDGTYRLKYSIKNGSNVSEGTVYTVYTAGN